MKRNLAETIVVFSDEEYGRTFNPDDLECIPENFEGDVVIMGNLCGEGDIYLKGSLWVYGQIEIEGDIEAEFVFAKGILCETLKAGDVHCFGNDIECSEIIVARDLYCISKIKDEKYLYGGLIECESDLEVGGNVLCKSLSTVDVNIKGDLCVYTNISSADVSVRGNLYCREKIMVEDLVVSGSIFCSSDINSEKDLIVKGDILCENIEVVDIGIDGDIFCKSIVARNMELGGKIKCKNVEISSINSDLD